MIGALRRRPTVVAALLVLLLGTAAGRWAAGLELSTAALIAWCVATLVHIGPTAWLMQHASPEDLRRHADLLDEGQSGVMAASVAAVVASVAGAVWHIGVLGEEPAQVVLGITTIALSWLLVHMQFAAHYCHEYWQHGGGLDFPGDEAPDFSEFVYFALTIGMTFQVSDVTTSSRAMRRVVSAQALLSFLFNAVIVAGAVNLAVGR
jgi:uncharacterized membrane protein